MQRIEILMIDIEGDGKKKKNKIGKEKKKKNRLSGRTVKIEDRSSSELEILTNENVQEEGNEQWDVQD